MNSDQHPGLADDLPEADEADALEQRLPVTEDQPEESPHLGAEVPEADALDQARAVPLDEDEEHDAG